MAVNIVCSLVGSGVCRTEWAVNSIHSRLLSPPSLPPKGLLSNKKKIAKTKKKFKYIFFFTLRGARRGGQGSCGGGEAHPIWNTSPFLRLHARAMNAPVHGRGTLRTSLRKKNRMGRGHIHIGPLGRFGENEP